MKELTIFTDPLNVSDVFVVQFARNPANLPLSTALFLIIYYNSLFIYKMADSESVKIINRTNYQPQIQLQQTLCTTKKKTKQKRNV